MAWKWRLESSTGEVRTSDLAAENEFPSRADAESWIGEVWHDLLEDGIEQVTLLEDDHEAYGPMSLRTD